MPATCSICLERFTSPVSLPCGHLFCRECIRRTVESVKSCSVQNSCPACRAPFSVLTVDPVLVPPYLRPHVLPPIRQVFINDPAPTPSPPAAVAKATAASSTSTSSSTPVACAPGSTSTPASASASSPAASSDLARALAEVHALRAHCATWRRRAEVQSAANTNLLGFVRAAKDCALRMRAERDTDRSQGVLLKRKLAELMPDNMDFDSESPFTKRKREDKEKPVTMVPGPRRAGLPIYLLQCKPHAQFYDDPTDMEKSHFGPPMTRRTPKRAQCDSPGKAETAAAAVAVPDTKAVALRKLMGCGGAGRISDSAPQRRLSTVDSR